MADKKLGIYLCSGCDIGKCLEVDKLAELANGEENVTLCKQHEFLCGDEGVQLIKDDIKNEGLTGVIIGACSGRVNTDEFSFDSSVLLERVNLREQVVWTHEPNDEDTQMMAEDYIKMTVAKVNTSEVPKPFVSDDFEKTIMVVGGGTAGLNAALGGAKAGYKVALIEKEDKLGGWATKYKKVFPKNPPYKDLEDTNIEGLIKEVTKNDNITIHLSSTIKSTDGQPGQFDVTLDNGNGGVQLKAGAIVQSTGWKPYDASKINHLSFGQLENVVTNVMFEEMVSEDKVVRPSDNKPIESIAFVQCAGSRDEEHLPYCSGVCCRVSLKQAKYVREKYPNAKIYLLYKDVRTPAQYELFYAETQKDDKTFLTKGDVVAVKDGGQDNLVVELDDSLLGERIQVKADMVVLATGMVPTTLVEAAVEGAEVEATQTADGKKEAESAEKGAQILNLNYRQGTDLPTLKYGFPDSHYICFPYETRRTGIYAAGCVRAPLDMAASKNDANGAMLKAIQAVENLSVGRAVHPRSGDESFPEFFMQRCTQCKRCTEECPFGTINEDDKGTPEPFLNRCRRCGICLGSCPERIITFKNYSINNISEMIKSLEIPDELDEKPRILAFMCENDAIPALDIVGMKRIKWSPFIRIIPVRCLGAVNAVWIADAMSKGYDGVMMIGCKHGDDYQCHFIKGSELANTRMDNVKDKLQQLALEEERVELHEINLTEYDKLPGMFNDFVEVIDDVGMNPFKGF